MSLGRIIQVINDARFRWADEIQLQMGIAMAFADEGIEFEREVHLDNRDRIDFMIDDIGMEIKIAGNVASVLRQLHRYANHDEIAELILVTTRASHLVLPRSVGGKALTTVLIKGIR